MKLEMDQIRDTVAVGSVPTGDTTPSILTLGGCGSYDIGQHFKECGRVQHYWRRPVIALMSNPVRDFSQPEMSDAVRKYVAGDCQKLHLREISDFEPDIILVDVVKDIITRVIQIFGGYLANPSELIGIDEVSGPSDLTGFHRIIEQCGGRFIGFNDEFFIPLWKSAFDRFLDHVETLKRKPRIFILETYFTSIVIGRDSCSPLDPTHAENVNAVLAIMYDYLRTKPQVTFLTVPPLLRFTHEEAAWGGPFYTHLTVETWLIAALQLSRLTGLNCPAIEDRIIDRLITNARERILLKERINRLEDAAQRAIQCLTP